MNEELLEKRIINSTNFLLHLNNAEIRTINEYINFVTWIFGLVSGGFILFVTNMRLFQNLLENTTYTSYWVFFIIFAVFLISIFLCVLYRLVAYKLIGKYNMNSNHLCSQKDLLIENLDLIPKSDKKSNVMNLKFNCKLAEFQYLDKNIMNQFQNETNPNKFSKISRLIFFLILICFVLEYGGIFYFYLKINF